MSPQPFAFDAVLFDLDGTLVATDRFWPEAARAGAIRAFRERGIERELPTAEDWMSMVGLTLDEGFAHVFSDLPPDDRAAVMEACLEEESRALEAGGAAMLPGVRETLDELRERGVRLGIASNCGRGYLDAMLEGLGLSEWIEEPRCLDSNGVSTKAEMVEDLLLTFGTRSAVMVGDRYTDRDAAWANGLPHVHLARGFAARGETVDCEAVIDGMDELVPRLSRRDAWLDGALDRLAAPPGAAIGVTGLACSGKTLFARDLARRLGDGATVVELDAYRREAPDGDDPLTGAYDVDALLSERLEPHARGSVAGALVLEGPFLLHPAVSSRLSRVLYLDAPEDVRLRRAAGREGPLAGPAALEPLRSGRLPAEAAIDERYPPAVRADLVLGAENALGPA